MMKLTTTAPKQFILLVFVVIAFGAPAVAQQKDSPHASREAVLAFLRDEGLLSGKTRVKYITWSEDAHWWSVSLRHPGGGISNWTVDADARDYHYVCKH
jgi:hypothetical protein